jgi:hypothetical protein
MDYYGMNELPNSYKRYKGLTGYFEKWLMNTAKDRGLEIAAQVEAAAATQKKNGESKRHHIPTKDLLPMAKAVAKSGQPSRDVSGLADLTDAIRIRKEVTEWYRLQQKSDVQHPFFISVLSDVRKVLKDWIFVAPKQPEARNVTKGSPNDKKQNSFDRISAIFGYLNDPTDPDEGIDDPKTSSNSEGERNRSITGTDSDKRLISSTVPDADPQVSKAGLITDREFEVLCFLYDLYVLRRRIKSVWSSWSQRKIGTMTAAIVSDLAMAHIQQRATNIAKEMHDDGNNQDILGIVDKLIDLIPEDQREVTLSVDENRVPEFPRNLLCYDGIRIMREYWRLETAGVGATHGLPQEDAFRLRFLLHFKVISARELEAPAIDKFTESLCSPEARSEAWLPFGFQVLLDIQQLLLVEDKTMGDLKDDVLDHGQYTEEIMRLHMEYEDKMCAMGEKPGYMSNGGFKFSNTYLPTLVQLLDWRLQLQHDASEKVSEMRNLSFVAAHPIFCGLTMRSYHRLYHSSAIATVPWFIVGLAHLYNACRQVGGLTSPWPDLDFIIQSQGPARIFVGGPPTDPHTFYQRVRLAIGISALAISPPLEDKITAYYNTRSCEKRSSQLHNIFVFLHNDLRKATDKCLDTWSSAETPAILQHKDKVRSIFDMIATKRALGTKNKKTRKKNRSKIPDFSRRDVMHDSYLDHATSQLAEHELYANFDHFAFFRRAHIIFQRIRTGVLWNESQALVTLDAPQEPPSDVQLLVNLLFDIAPPNNKNNRLCAPKYASGMEKLKKISKIMQEFIQEQGDLEMKNAEDELKRRRQHGTLPRKKLSFESIKEVTSQDLGCQHGPFLEVESKRSKDDAAPDVPDAFGQPEHESSNGSTLFHFGNHQNSAFDFGQPELEGSNGSEPFHFGNHRNSAFEFECAVSDCSDTRMATKAREETPSTASVFREPGQKGTSEPGGAANKPQAESDTIDVAVKPEAKPGLANAFVQPEAASILGHPEDELRSDLEPQRDDMRMLEQDKNRNMYHRDADAADKGKPSASRIEIASPTLIQARVDQEYHGGYAGWSDQPGLGGHQPDAQLHGPSAATLFNCILGEPVIQRIFGIYHRFTYRTTRSTRPMKVISPKRRHRILSHTPSALRPRRRLVGATKHRISHNCWGRCMVGRIVLGDDYDVLWSRPAAPVPEDDGWETGDEQKNPSD